MFMIDTKWFETTGLLFYLDETAWLHFLTIENHCQLHHSVYTTICPENGYLFYRML